MQSQQIKLVLPTAPERKAVESFIKEQYARRMHLVPPLPEMIFAAFLGDIVIGTVAIEFSTSDPVSLPFEQIFPFDISLLSLPWSPKQSVQFSRWAVLAPDTSGPVVYAAVRYALDHGKRYGWCELKPGAIKRLLDMGVTLYEVQTGPINVHNVHESVITYYTEPPYPKLYQLDLVQMAHALE